MRLASDVYAALQDKMLRRSSQLRGEIAAPQQEKKKEQIMQSIIGDRLAAPLKGIPRTISGIFQSFRWALEVQQRCRRLEAAGRLIDGDALHRIIGEIEARREAECNRQPTADCAKGGTREVPFGSLAAGGAA